MTDEENQRQRAYAAALIAQCDGKTVQMHDRGREAQPYEDICVAAIYIDMTQYDIRIKPEPREWFLCLACNGRYCNGMPVHDFPGTGRHCHGEKVKVREVLND